MLLRADGSEPGGREVARGGIKRGDSLGPCPRKPKGVDSSAPWRSGGWVRATDRSSLAAEGKAEFLATDASGEDL